MFIGLLEGGRNIEWERGGGHIKTDVWPKMLGQRWSFDILVIKMSREETSNVSALGKTGSFSHSSWGEVALPVFCSAGEPPVALAACSSGSGLLLKQQL